MFRRLLITSRYKEIGFCEWYFKIDTSTSAKIIAASGKIDKEIDERLKKGGKVYNAMKTVFLRGVFVKKNVKSQY